MTRNGLFGYQKNKPESGGSIGLTESPANTTLMGDVGKSSIEYYYQAGRRFGNDFEAVALFGIYRAAENKGTAGDFGGSGQGPERTAGSHFVEWAARPGENHASEYYLQGDGGQFEMHERTDD